MSSSCSASPAEGVRYPDSEAITGWTERLQPSPADLRSCSPQELLQQSSSSSITDLNCELHAPLCSYVERLKKDTQRWIDEDGEDKEDGGQRGLDRSSYHHAIAALENTSDEEEGEAAEEEDRREKATCGFQRPVVETESMFRPAEFGSRLLPPENKPLEMVVLKKAKELLLNHNHQSIARHLLVADCQVFTHSSHRNKPRRFVSI